ncbi:homer protein homolog 2 isoform X2 [Lingula anatina]|uniref:Homer protein homolog 2 isoform X2 n=1 Tax=Lingula anatina TaxID=7574 RepID=A0A1S3HGD5_LINAN|nr:homer protein homolog 2 isoform X2 [Lingula anatina]|eukprot:XP_013385143.1 homer protein homolog 2 isoform X2 [Lingula anatina]
MSLSTREQPIYTTKAHVFQIDPQTKKNWMPASTVAVSVAYYYDSNRNSYRIISVEGTKAIINSTITPNMTFTKTSQKFGQWSDPRANTVYGLGFATEADLQKFIEKFQEVRELAKQTPGESNGSGEPHSPLATHPVHAAPLHSRNSSVSSNQSDGSEKQQRLSTSGLPTVEYQLKYENDRLKIALAQSSANAKKWEIELQTLKNNNARLTTALQESTANVEEWKKQLAAYKEESAKLKKQTIELEQTANDEQISGLQQQLKETTEQLQAVEQERDSTTEELRGALKRLEELNIRVEQNGKNEAHIKDLEKENSTLRKKVSSLESELKQLKLQQSKDRHELLTLHKDIGTKLQEVTKLHEKLAHHPVLSQSDA